MAGQQDSLFDDGKAPEAFRTIGEVAAALKIKPHVLRYWEEQFEMLRPIKRGGGRRYYRPEDVALVQRIDRLLNREGYTIRGAARALANQEPDAAATGQVENEISAPDPRTPSPSADPDAAVAERLRHIREVLAEALASP